ncbi:MAG: helix-turn-helix domain-containing protein [Solirubrobacteraceae bacterium]
MIITIHPDPRRAEVQIVCEGGARTELTVALVKRGTERHRTSEDTIELVRKLAAHTRDQQIAAILNKQGRRTGTGLPFNQPRVASIRVKHGIPAAPPPDPASDLFTVEQAADELRVAQTTIYRWLRAGLLPAQQTTPHAPWRTGSLATCGHGSCPTFPRTIYRSSRPPSDSGARDRPFCIRSNAANCTPSKSSADGGQA